MGMKEMALFFSFCHRKGIKHSGFVQSIDESRPKEGKASQTSAT
jgi:hypothetical protein